MSNENKTALTAEEILSEVSGLEIGTIDQSYSERLVLLAIESALEQAKKEIEELKECIFNTEGQRHLEIESLQSQLSEVTKKRDELKIGIVFIKTHPLTKELLWLRETCDLILTPTKEERKEGECEHIAVLIDNKPVYCCSKCDKIIDN